MKFSRTIRTFSSTAIAGLMAALPAASQAQASSAPEASPTPLTGNMTLVSDYRFRGISQTYRLPAVQAGFDYTHSSGLYLGNWNSNVSGNSYNNGASLEVDLYGGYRFNVVQDLQADVGVLHYAYPGARLNSAPGVASDNHYDNTEIYFGATYGSFSGKLSYAVSNYFGLNSDTAGYAYWTSLPANGDSKGTIYIDLNYSLDLGDKFALAAHVGRTVVAHYGALSYTDGKLALTKEWSGLTFGAAVVATNANRDFYQVGNSAWENPKKLGATGVVLSVGKTF